MKKLYKSILFLILISSSLFSQTVKTVVAGPSTFNDGLALDKHGNIYASLYYGQTVTKISPSGTTSIFANGFGSPNGIKFGPDGYLYVPSVDLSKIHRVSPEGIVEEYINIQKPSELYFDKDGLLYVTNYTDSKISVIDQNKNITELFSGGKLDGPIGILKDDNGTIYIGNFNNGKVFKITDGNNFTEIGQLPGWLGFMILIDDHIYATAYQANKIYKIAIDGSGQSVFAGSGIKGQKDGPALTATFNNPNGIVATSTSDTIYVSDYSSRSLRMITGVKQTTTDVNSINEIPKDFSLEQNYPNPFNPSTTIEYHLPKNSFVNISVYNMLGQKVATVVNKFQSQGNYQINFDASKLSSGVYMYKLNADGFTQSKKMVLA
ncbi:MAG: T9SS type A sorting domain-containing protein, partial [Melioribacteraceae bacterium]